MVIRARHQHRAGGRTRRGDVELGQPDPSHGKRVEVGRFYFTAKGTDIGVSEIIGDDQKNVGSVACRRLRRLVIRRRAARAEQEGAKEKGYACVGHTMSLWGACWRVAYEIDEAARRVRFYLTTI